MWAWATMTSMVENMSELLVGSYCVLIPCLTRPRITRSVTRSVPTRVASARPCVSNKKSAGPAWQLCQALDGYSLSLPKCSINRSASNLDRIKNQAIAKQSGCVHTICTNVRTPSQFIVVLAVLIHRSQNFGDFYVGLCRFVKRLCVRPWPARGMATAIEVGTATPQGIWASSELSAAIRGFGRQNFARRGP